MGGVVFHGGRTVNASSSCLAPKTAKPSIHSSTMIADARYRH